jgi:hypothetical protein
MSLRALGAVLAVWAFVSVVLCSCVHHVFALDPEGNSRREPVVATVWVRGKKVARSLVARIGDSDASLDAALASSDAAVVRYETVVAQGSVPTFDDDLLALSLVPGRDGLVASMAAGTEFLTPDDLLAHQAYRHGIRLPVVDLTVGVDTALAFALLADRFGVSVRELRGKGSLRRARFERASVERAHGEPDSVPSDDVMLDAALAAGRFLARGVDAAGRFRFLIDAVTNEDLPGYDWPRHAGSTYFLAQAAARSNDPELGSAAVRAGDRLRTQVTDCGATRCIADGEVADLGSSALAALAFAELARTGLDRSFRFDVAELTPFLRGQQRPDGEFMHRYDRAASRPVDVQLLYYSGEAALALSRAHGLAGDPRDLEAATRALTYLVGPAWSFFGSRYYFGEEHWTCTAMADLWDRAPNPAGLAFCLRWLGFWRAAQQTATDSAYDADGAYGVGPVQVPPLTPVASRCEAGLATLGVARRAGVAPHEIDALETQMKRSLALLLRRQIRAASPTYLGLLSNPGAVDGAFPASEVEWSLRVDFAQHAGSALLAALAVTSK